MKQDITNLNDIKHLVDSFYKKAGKDELIGPVFTERLEGKWDEHHEKLYRFWQTIILREMSYYNMPVEVHFNMKLTTAHFDRWLLLWYETVDELFSGVKADRAKLRGKTMSEAFLKKINKHSNKNLEQKG